MAEIKPNITHFYRPGDSLHQAIKKARTSIQMGFEQKDLDATDDWIMCCEEGVNETFGRVIYSPKLGAVRAMTQKEFDL